MANEWGHTTYWSHDTKVSRGVGILINKTASINVLDSFSDASGRVIGLHYEENREVCAYKCIRSKRRIFFLSFVVKIPASGKCIKAFHHCQTCLNS